MRNRRSEESDHENGQSPLDDEQDERTGSPGARDDATSLTGRLMYLFVLLRRSEARLRNAKRAGSGILEGQGRVLRLLTLHSPIAQKDLAYLLGIRSQSLGELLAKLEAARLVTRKPNAADRRTMVVEITDKGRAAVERQADLVDDDPFAALTEDERTQLAALLDVVIDAAEKRFPGGIDRGLATMRRLWFGMPGGVDGGIGWDFDGPVKFGGIWLGAGPHRGDPRTGRERRMW